MGRNGALSIEEWRPRWPPLWVQSTYPLADIFAHCRYCCASASFSLLARPNKLDLMVVSFGTSVPPPFCQWHALAHFWLKWTTHFDFPYLLWGEFSDTAVSETATHWMDPIDERNTPNFVSFVITSESENWFVRAAFIDIPRLQLQLLEDSIHHDVEMAHAEWPSMLANVGAAQHATRAAKRQPSVACLCRATS